MLDSLNFARKEMTLERFLPFSSIVSPGIVICRGGELIGTLHLQGLPFETVEDEDLNIHSDQLNTLFQSMADSSVAVQCHRVRSPVTDTLSLPQEAGFARNLAERYYAEVNKKQMIRTDFYVTLILRNPSVLPGIRRKKARSKEQIEFELNQRIEAFEKRMLLLERTLARYAPHRLKEYRDEEENALLSEQLAFYNFLITGRMQQVRVPYAPIYEVLGNTQLFRYSDILELQSVFGKNFCQALEIKDYPACTWPAFLTKLLYPEEQSRIVYPFVETQTFAFFNRQDAVDAFSEQRRFLANSKDAAASQIEAMDRAIDDIASGNIAAGLYNYNLLIFGNTKEDCERHTRDCAAKLTQRKFIPVLATRALIGNYFSQLPTMFSYQTRQAKLSTMNFAHLTGFHNFAQGKRDGNPWGEALALLQTPSCQPYYFNFHSSPPLENSFNKKYLANTLILGTAGSGKTALMGFLICMLQKYRTENQKLTVIYFDKDRGAEIAIRTLGGGYLTVQNGMPTGFNPLALDATEENIQFLDRWLRLLICSDGTPVNTEDGLKLNEALRSVMRMPKELRRLALIPQNLVTGSSREEQTNSLTKRLSRWVDKGDLAWVFDNPEDSLDFDRYPNFGIDGTEFLDNPMICSPISFYLLYRMESVIDGRRFVFFMDEFWKWLKDEAFRDFAFNKLKTIRKQNGLGVFATQSPSDVLGSEIAKAVIENSETFIYLPNPRGDKDEYTKGFKLSPKEFELVRGLPEQSRTMLIKQFGGASESNSAICGLNLSAFPKALKVLSGSTDNIEKLHGLLQKYGSAPGQWLPHFLEPQEKPS